MLWEKCIPNKFYRIICQNSYFINLDQLNVTYNKANDIMNEFASVRSCSSFARYFEEYRLVYQYVCSVLFPKFIILNQKYGVEI